MRTKLTPTFVAKAAPTAGLDRTIFWDEGLPGFGLMVTEAGSKSWVVQYRTNGRSRRATIPSVLTLDKARKQARGLLGEVAKGGDPVAERRAAEAAAANTLQNVAEEYLKREGKNLRTHAQRRATLERLVFPKLGARQIAEIKRSEITRLLDHIEDKAGPVQADMVLGFLRRIFNWHASRTDDFRSPIIRGMSRSNPRERARNRILSDDELRALWKADIPLPWRPFVRFLLLTAARRNEAARMARSELKVAGVWTIPAGRYKTKTDVTLPLSASAQAVLAELPRFGTGEYVFTVNGRAPLAAFSRGKKTIDKASGVTSWTLHDLRRTARSLMSRAGVSSDHAERCLGHIIPGVRGTYDRHKYLEEMRRAFEALASQIERIVNPHENVVQLNG
jgi:integrase